MIDRKRSRYVRHGTRERRLYRDRTRAMSHYTQRFVIICCAIRDISVRYVAYTATFDPNHDERTRERTRESTSEPTDRAIEPKESTNEPENLRTNPSRQAVAGDLESRSDAEACARLLRHRLSRLLDERTRDPPFSPNDPGQPLTGGIEWDIILEHCGEREWCPGTDLNRRHTDFQSVALPTELPGRAPGYRVSGRACPAMASAVRRAVEGAGGGRAGQPASLAFCGNM
jgi:hypothetical protein